MYLWNRHSRGQIPAGCLGRNEITCILQYVHKGLYLGRNEKKAVFSFCSSPAIYSRQVTQRKELNKERVVTHYCQYRRIRQIRQMWKGYIDSGP